MERLSFRLENTIKLLNVLNKKLRKLSKPAKCSQINFKDELIKLVPLFNLKEESEVLDW